MKALRAALERLEKGEHEPALASLLEAWRALPAPAIADAIDRLGARLTQGELPIRKVGATSAKGAWEEAAKSGRPAILGRLLEAIDDSVDKLRQLEALAKMPPDPRVATQAKRWVAEPPVLAKSRPGFFGRVVKLLEHTGDTRVAPFLAQLVTEEARQASIQRYGLRSWVPLRALAERLSSLPVPALDPESAVLVTRIDGLLARPLPAPVAAADADPAVLYAQIYEAPNDDDVRAILSDLLQQRRDPRGEFIALQLARHGTSSPKSAQERKLEQQWGRDWLGAIEPAVQKAGVEFERGFVTHVRYIGGNEGMFTKNAPEWSTVTHIDCAHASKYVGGSGDLLIAPVMKSLRHVVGLDESDFARIAAAKSVPWETVGWRIWHWDRMGRIGAGPAGVFEAARTLILSAASNQPLSVIEGDIARLIAMWPSIDAFEIDALPNLLVPLRKLAPAKRLARLTLDASPMRASVERSGDDGDTLRVELRHLNAEVAGAVAHMIANLGIVRAEIRTNGNAKLDRDTLSLRHSTMPVGLLRHAAKSARVALTIAGSV